VLYEQIDSMLVPYGQLALWALGQSGFAVKGGDTIVYIDPYLSDSVAAGGGPERRFPPPLEAASVAHAQAVFASHDHLDHVDEATLTPMLAASPQARLITSPQGAARLRGAGLASDRILTPALGEEYELGALRYTAIPAAHYAFEVDNAGCASYQGFVLRLNGVTLYHAGDTIIFPELLEALAAATASVAIDIALLPINGRDGFREARGIVGNLLPEEAVLLAQRIGARTLIAMHNDMFATNRVNPALLFDALDRHAPFLPCHVLQPGELYLVVASLHYFSGGHNP
jgi:L-ascorbate metabolism protein UlaG (beta-lactamase superfamily)